MAGSASATESAGAGVEGLARRHSSFSSLRNTHSLSPVARYSTRCASHWPALQSRWWSTTLASRHLPSYPSGWCHRDKSRPTREGPSWGQGPDEASAASAAAAASTASRMDETTPAAQSSASSEDSRGVGGDAGGGVSGLPSSSASSVVSACEGTGVSGLPSSSASSVVSACEGTRSVRAAAESLPATATTARCTHLSTAALHSVRVTWSIHSSYCDLLSALFFSLSMYSFVSLWLSR